MTGAIFYVYEHWRPDKDVCFWVGKGSGSRARLFRRNRYYNNIIAKLSRLGMCVEVRMVQSGLTEAAAHILEMDRIAFWRAASVLLANMTNGGEGISGLKHSAATRAKMKEKRKLQSRVAHSAVMKGRKHSSEHRAKISAGLKGRVHSAQTKEKIRKSNLGQKRSVETRENLRQSHLGKTQTVATKQKRRLALNRYWKIANRDERAALTRAGYTPQVRANLSEKQKARFSTPQGRALCREYANRRWERVRAEAAR